MSYTTSAIDPIFKPITKVLVNGLPFWEAVREQGGTNRATGSIQAILFPSGKIVEVDADTVIWYTGIDEDHLEMYKDGKLTEQQFFKSYTVLKDGQLSDEFGTLTLEDAEWIASLLRSTVPNLGPAINYSVVDSDLAFDGMPER